MKMKIEWYTRAKKPLNGAKICAIQKYLSITTTLAFIFLIYFTQGLNGQKKQVVAVCKCINLQKQWQRLLNFHCSERLNK